MKAIQRAKRVGGSLMVRIPKEIVDLEQIEPGQPIQIEVHRLRKDWFGALKGIGPMRKEDKFDLHG